MRGPPSKVTGSRANVGEGPAAGKIGVVEHRIRHLIAIAVGAIHLGDGIGKGVGVALVDDRRKFFHRAVRDQVADFLGPKAFLRRKASVTAAPGGSP